MVRLLPVRKGLGDQVTSVSIPQWCDCCAMKEYKLPLPPESFNPTMVRLLPGRAHKAANEDLRFNPTMVRLLQFQHLLPAQ